MAFQKEINQRQNIMNPNEDQFDDFKVPEAAAYVNEAIGKVFEKELTEVEQFKDDLDDQLLADNYI